MTTRPWTGCTATADPAFVRLVWPDRIRFYSSIMSPPDLSRGDLFLPFVTLSESAAREEARKRGAVNPLIVEIDPRGIRQDFLLKIIASFTAHLTSLAGAEEAK